MRMFYFGNKTTVFRKKLNAVLQSGDTQALELLLKGMDGFPKSLLTAALEKTIAQDMLKPTELLIRHGGEPNAIEGLTLRHVVYDLRLNMFRTLVAAGVDFEAQAATPKGEYYTQYINNLQTLTQRLQQEKTAAGAKTPEEIKTLREEIADLKEELTAVRQSLQKMGITLPPSRRREL